ncbi:DUF3105 domain-containing protein [Naasia sp. SYSU D00948]|uniref:DUF3105 domain-containing protein n=1 Tax=Naasia sp. SYSU D00948 TaxID=2817379 RepID=UPI001B30C51E|nr:DUF3105 domain-containing protein [Naasia sp. SYSU D00948]
MPSSNSGRTPSTGNGLSVKQQRAADRAAKLEKFRKENERRKRNKRIGIAAAIVGGLAIVALLVVSFVLAPKPATYSAGSEGREVPGVETFENVSTHVTTPVTYPQTPPTGGEHNPAWLNCGVYTEAVPNEYAVHSLEHGAIWITYDPSQVSEEDIAALRSLMPSRHALLSPYEGMDSPIAVSAWNAQVKLDSVDRETISAFFEEYWLSEDAPEPGASCSGAVDGPGKVA